MAQPCLDWNPVRRLIRLAQREFQLKAKNLRRCIECSDKALRPLRDPLHVDLGGHRWLQASREESYSDWLAWLLQQLPPSAICRILGVHSNSAATTEILSAKTVDRERWVKLEHWCASRKIDVLISFGDCLILVEVKVVTPDQADLDKNAQYAEWLARRPEQEKHKILISLRGDISGHANKGHFNPRFWDEVCVQLRKEAKAQVYAENVIRAAMMLAFVGAVEQNLLKFSSGHVRRVMDEEIFPLTSDMSEHLANYLGEDLR